MKIPRVATVDFETHGIEGRPKYPPLPVGVSIRLPGERKARYWAWGHPTGNNCSPTDGLMACRRVFRDRTHGLLFHNAKFDTEVYEHWMDPGWQRDPLDIHDTMYLLAQMDPYAMSYKLKPSAARLLGIPPEEQDAVKDWLVANVPEVKRKPSEFGQYIWMAPGPLVGKYADGDIERTLRLFIHCWKWLVAEGSVAAYQREQKLMPILQRNEREGMRCDVRRLEKEVPVYQQAMLMTDAWLRKRLKAPDLNIDSDRDLAEALGSTGVVTEWTLTEKSQMPSVSKKNLTLDKFNDPRVGYALGYRNRLATCLGTFMQPWLMQARGSGGWIHTNWRQVKGGSSNGEGGANTGRMQSSPNFQNVPKSFEGRDGYTHPAFIKGLPELPRMRAYILPDSADCWFVVRDYNQQELRILAHYEGAALLQAYIENPRLDVHQFVREAIHRIFKLDLPRDKVKTLNFGMLYGMGLGPLAVALQATVTLAKELKAAQLGALPGLKGLQSSLKKTGRDGEAIYTWGGRPYKVEPAHMVKGKFRTFEYKLLNQLIQGSASDCTKEAIIRYDALPNRVSRLLVAVHDEIDTNCPKKAMKRETQRLREVMQSVEFDVPMLSDCKYGANWADVRKYEEA